MAEKKSKPAIKSIKLVITRSKVGGGGIARVNEKVMKRLNTGSGDFIGARYKDDIILVKGVADHTMGMKDISLRAKDINRLKAKVGTEVEIFHHKTLVELAEAELVDVKQKMKEQRAHFDKWVKKERATLMEWTKKHSKLETRLKRIKATLTKAKEKLKTE